MRDEVRQLVALQAKDGLCVELELQLKRLERARVKEGQALARRRSDLEVVRQQVKDLERESRLKNLAVDDLDEQIRGYQRKLSEGIISFKEMQALEEKITNQRQRIGRMEDEALALMEEVEQRRQQLREEEETFKKHERDSSARDRKLKARMTQVTEEISQANQGRSEVAKGVPAHFLSRYEELHSRFNDPVVAIVNGSCSGCKLKLSGNTVERARSSVEIVTCEHCSRILYVG